MTTIFENDVLENISLEELDSLEFAKADEVISEVRSNTVWSDTSKHITHNGSGMNCP